MSTKTDYRDWPKRGDTRPQPWQNLDSGVTPRAGLPLLVSGGATGPGPLAQGLFTALAELGYQTPISQGANPFGIIGPEELAAVRQFRRDYGVQADPTAFGGDNAHGHQVADSHIDGYTGEAILRAAAAQGAPAVDTETELAALRERVRKLETAAKPKTTTRKPAATKPVAKAAAAAS